MQNYYFQHFLDLRLFLGKTKTPKCHHRKNKKKSRSSTLVLSTYYSHHFQVTLGKQWGTEDVVLSARDCDTE